MTFFQVLIIASMICACIHMRLFLFISECNHANVLFVCFHVYICHCLAVCWLPHLSGACLPLKIYFGQNVYD